MWLFRRVAKYGRPPVMLAYRFLVLPLGLFKTYKSPSQTDEPAGPPPSPATISIDASNIIGEINPFIYGGFIEFIGNCIEGIWDENNQNVPLIHGGLRQDVLEKIRGLNISVIRWPGGCFSDIYRWKDGIGPRGDRKPGRNKFWHWFGPKIGHRIDNHFGMDEFMLFIGELDTEPYVNINYGSGTPEEARQWVEYANGDESTEFGSFRAKNGHPKPYNVKIWGIANEIYGFHEEGYSTAKDYAHGYIKFAKAMRTVDPSIKLVAVGTDFSYRNWNRILLGIAGEYIDYLSLHIYTPLRFIDRISNNVKDYYRVIAGAPEFERRIKWVEASIVEVMGEDRKIPIALDEWGAWWNFRQLFESYATLRDGIFAASVFEVFHRNVNAVEMANYAQIVNVIPLIVTNEADSYHNPIYLAFQIFSKYSEPYAVASDVTCDTRTTPKWGVISEGELPYLGCSVTINKVRDKLVIFGINRHHAHNLPTAVALTNFKPNSTAIVFELNGPSHSAYNSFDNKEIVKITEKSFNSASSEFKYTFPAHSLTSIVLQKEK